MWNHGLWRYFGNLQAVVVLLCSMALCVRMASLLFGCILYYYYYGGEWLPKLCWKFVSPSVYFDVHARPLIMNSYFMRAHLQPAGLDKAVHNVRVTTRPASTNRCKITLRRRPVVGGWLSPTSWTQHRSMNQMVHRSAFCLAHIVELTPIYQTFAFRWTSRPLWGTFVMLWLR